MSILEKAFAKLQGNYSSLVAGSPERAVQALIGTPGSNLNIRAMTTTAIYDTISKIQIEDVMIAISWSTSFYGITATHAYTLIENYTVQKISGGTVQLIKLRDPWGSDSGFKGEYRDGDILWSDVSAAEKTRIGYTINAMDGTFFMTVVQFKEAFSSISFSKMLKDWTRSYFLILDDKLVNPGKNINGGPLYTRHEFTITSALSQNAIFQVNNHEKRTYPMITGCGAGIGVVNVKTIVEWSLPGSSGQTWFQEGEYNLKSGEPYAL